MSATWQRRRVALVIGVLFAGFSGLGFRLYELHVLRGEQLSAQAAGSRAQVIHRLGKRGAILDVNGNLLATSLPARIVVADPSVTVSNAVTIARQLAPLLQMEEAALILRLTRGGRYVRLRQKVEEETAQKIRALGLRGISFEEQFVRSYPNGPLASHVIGFVDAEHNGVQGVEASFDNYLRGRPGYEIMERDRKGRELRAYRIENIGPRDGYHVVLTIDQVIQHIAETELERAMAEFRPKAALIIVSRPGTGEILAMSCRPSFDPNQPGAAPADARRNRCISDVAEPGSTFKVVSIAGALNDGVVTLDDRFDCENGAWFFAGRMLHDAHPHGVLTVRQILYKSSNIGAAKIAVQRMGPHRVYEYNRRFGFGSRTGIALPGEVAGISHPVSRWSKLSISRIPMGHEIAATSIQMMMAVNAVANGGSLMRPLIVRQIRDENGAVIMDYQPQVAAACISPRASLLMNSALREVVTREGTATKAAVAGYDVAGKTGTAQKIEQGRYVRKYYSSFIGWLPAYEPQLSILVSLDEPSASAYYGGSAAGPVFRNVAEKVARYLGIPPQTETATGDLS
jgi:cell division protein FtsI/penicillin-binding protein 2